MKAAEDPTDKVHDMKKKAGSLTRIEKRKLYGGDKSILYEKLGLVEEQDLEKYRKKFGIKKDVNLDNVDVDEILEESAINVVQTKRKGKL